jgi:hypothetical protein
MVDEMCGQIQIENRHCPRMWLASSTPALTSSPGAVAGARKIVETCSHVNLADRRSAATFMRRSRSSADLRSVSRHAVKHVEVLRWNVEQDWARQSLWCALEPRCPATAFPAARRPASCSSSALVTPSATPQHPPDRRFPEIACLLTGPDRARTANLFVGTPRLQPVHTRSKMRIRSAASSTANTMNPKSPTSATRRRGTPVGALNTGSYGSSQILASSVTSMSNACSGRPCICRRAPDSRCGR